MRTLLITYSFLALTPFIVCAQTDSVHKVTLNVCKCHILLTGQTDSMDFTISRTHDRIDTINTDGYAPMYLTLNSSCRWTRIINFEIMTSLDGLGKTFYSSSNIFSPEMIYILSGLGPGDHFVIQRVHIVYPDGRNAIIPGETVVIAKR